LDIDNNKILVCNCEKTMEIDGERITQGCQSNTKCNVNNNLCGSELNVVLEQLEYSKKIIKIYSLHALKSKKL
jgi:hypothetical protein